MKDKRIKSQEQSIKTVMLGVINMFINFGLLMVNITVNQLSALFGKERTSTWIKEEIITPRSLQKVCAVQIIWHKQES